MHDRSGRWLATAAVAMMLVAPAARAEDLRERVDRLERELQELKGELKRRDAAEAAREAEQAKTPPPPPTATPQAPTTVAGGGESTLQALRDRVRIGGYGSFRYEGTSLHAQKNTFTYRRFVLTTDANIAPRLHAYLELELERFRELELEKATTPSEGGLEVKNAVEGTNGSEISLEQAWLQYDFVDWLKFRGGAVLVPLGRFNINHDDNRWDLPRRSLVDRGTPVLPVKAAWDELGVGFLGDVPVGKEAQLGYQIYVVNGVTLDSTIETVARTRSPESPEQEIGVELTPQNGTFGNDVKDAKALTGRVSFSPWLGHEIAGSGYWGQYTPDIFGKQDLWALALDGRTGYGPFELEAEGVFTRFEGTGQVAREIARVAVDSKAETENPNLNSEVEFELSGLAKNKYGYWVEGRYRFWPQWLKDSIFGRYFDTPQLVAVLRGEQVWLDDLVTEATFGGGVLSSLGRENRFVDRMTAGLAYRPVPLVVFQLAYEFTWTNNGKSLSGPTNFLIAGPGEDQAHTLLVGAAFGF